ncbi:hypothetical protein [Endozoicomonas sp. ONNA1]|uniref:hypothetical protein n=1 Tax=Endozoicomonas sp. ONNA1 TaxID=2828740 RepID=UPI0021480090|nr:hypothetical protein [Endozoicomonas sp. ONNA1]
MATLKEVRNKLIDAFTTKATNEALIGEELVMVSKAMAAIKDMDRKDQGVFLFDTPRLLFNTFNNSELRFQEVIQRPDFIPDTAKGLILNLGYVSLSSDHNQIVMGPNLTSDWSDASYTFDMDFQPAYTAVNVALNPELVKGHVVLVKLGDDYSINDHRHHYTQNGTFYNSLHVPLAEDGSFRLMVGYLTNNTDGQAVIIHCIGYYQ